MTTMISIHDKEWHSGVGKKPPISTGLFLSDAANTTLSYPRQPGFTAGVWFPVIRRRCNLPKVCLSLSNRSERLDAYILHVTKFLSGFPRKRTGGVMILNGVRSGLGEPDGELSMLGHRPGLGLGSTPWHKNLQQHHLGIAFVSSKAFGKVARGHLPSFHDGEVPPQSPT